MFKTLKFDKYKINIRYRDLQVPLCRYPRINNNNEYIIPSRVYYNHNEVLVKQITYKPRELWYKPILLDDPLENYIIDLQHYYPDWELIEIDLI